jgi:Flp pilus assembly protein TadG
MNRKHSFIADQRGAVAFEMPIVTIFMIFSLLLPLADMSIAGFQYISAWQALRAFGQSIQYSPPPDVTNSSSWVSTATAKSDPNYPISNFQLICGDSNAVCSSGNTVSPKYYSYTTSFTVAPMVLKSVLCPGGNCTYTLPYSERFQ